MLSRCLSCGAPSPANRPEFYFVCEFCGSKNVDEEYLKERARASAPTETNKFLESALLAIESENFEKATKLIEESINSDSKNQEALIYQAYCHAALSKPSNFDKNFKVAQTALGRARSLGETDSYELGSNQVSNMFLERSPSAANYFFETARKKLTAYGENERNRASMSSEIIKGLELIKRALSLNPTDTDKKVKALALGLNEIYIFETSSKLSESLKEFKSEFYSILFEMFSTNREIVEESIQSVKGGTLILEQLRSANTPKDLETKEPPLVPTWIVVAAIAIIFMMYWTFWR